MGKSFLDILKMSIFENPILELKKTLEKMSCYDNALISISENFGVVTITFFTQNNLSIFLVSI
tara:strand:+ start:584 stop:772 length:189 start_codon:yes stop_codon:yes gene_type:complete